MADTVEVVIKIPKEKYEEITSLKWLNQGRENAKQLLFTLVNAVQDGTVLPKGHGDFIDARELEKDMVDYGWHHPDSTVNEYIEDFHKIVEADSEV